MAKNKLIVLAIDDIEDNLTTVKAVVKGSIPEAVVFTAPNGAKGIEVARKINPDLILLDILMPGMDGFETCKVIKSDPELGITPVVFLTALKSDRESRIKALNVGADGFVSKPIDSELLITQILAMKKLKDAELYKISEKVRLEELVLERTLELEKNNTELQAHQEMTQRALDRLSEEVEIRKRSDESRQKSERLMEQIFKILPVGLWIADKDGKLNNCNEAGKAIWGMEAFVGMENYGIFKARHLPSRVEIKPEDWALARTVLEGITVKDELMEIEAFDGVKRVILNYTAPVFDESKQVMAAIVVNQDISEDYRNNMILNMRSNISKAVATLNDLGELFSFIRSELAKFFDTTNFIYATYNENTDLFYAPFNIDETEENILPWKAGESLTGYLLKQKKPLLLSKENLRELSQNHDVEVLGVLPLVWMGVPLFKADKPSGAIIVQSYDDPDAYNETSLEIMEIIAHDMSVYIAKKDSEEAVHRSEEKYRMLFQEMIDGYALHEIILDDNGIPCNYRFLDANPAFERITGLKAKDIIGKTVLDVMPKTENHWIEAYGHVALSGIQAHFENYSSEMDKYLDVKAFSPAPLQFACIFSDVSERVMAEKEKEKLQNSLNQTQKMELVGQLAGGVAHDFNNLLTIILGYSSELLETLPENSQDKQDCTEIYKAGKRAKELTNQLLIFSRKQVVLPSVLDLNELIINLSKMLTRLIGEHIVICLDLAKGKLLIKADYGQVEQVIINLVVNGRDAMLNGGSITLSTSMLCNGDKLYPPAEQSGGNFIRFCVSDTGMGMDKATQDRIFEPFFTTKEKGKGLGLGLSTVYGIVNQAGGTIEVNCPPEGGTSMTVLFPAADCEIAAETPGGVQTVKIGKGEQILIVDDEEPLSKYLKGMLHKMGFQASIATSGTEALAMVKDGLKPALVITDVVMPEMNGRELTEAIETMLPGTRVMFMSGYTDDIIAPLGFKDKAIPYIQKPFSANELASKVHSLLYEGTE